MSYCIFKHLEFQEQERVLFLGEGNFSFSSSLLKHLKDNSCTINFKNIYVTCFQKNLTTLAEANVNILRSLGAKIFVDIDATKLQACSSLTSEEFDKIIFNFPHVGGKMKIHLNRELLKEFFISASKLLKPSGLVIVTLCRGQGGTEFDSISRSWNDSWQVVEQSAHGGFILSEVDIFPHELFPDYMPVGYRSREQKFNIESAVVHCFSKTIQPLYLSLSDSSLKDLQNFHHVTEDLLVSSVHLRAIQSSPLLRQNSPQHYLNNLIKTCITNNSLCPHVSEMQLPLVTNYNSLDAPCTFQRIKSCLRSSLLQVIPANIQETFFSDGLVFKKCSSDFSDLCARCHCLVKIPLSDVKNIVSVITTKFSFLGLVSEEVDKEGHWALYFKDDSSISKVIWGNINTILFTFDLDLISSFLFKIPIKQLWCPELLLDANKKSVILPSLYPLYFAFDVSFAFQGELDLNEFYYLLHQIPDNIINSVHLKSIFVLPDTHENSYCFRVTYRSYNKPLNRKLAIEFHDKILGKLLVNTLNVRIR